MNNKKQKLEKKISTKLTTQEYRRIEKSLENKIKELEPVKDDSIEYLDYKNILEKIQAIIARQEQKEVQDEDEFKNSRSKNKWQCSSCGIVKIAMIKQCTVCKNAGDNISLALLPDDENADDSEPQMNDGIIIDDDKNKEEDE